MATIRILQVVGCTDRGGAEALIMNLYRNIDRKKVQFDFVVHTTERCAYDDEIESLGGRIYSVPKYKVVNHIQYVNAWKNFFQVHDEYVVVHCHMYNVASIVLNIAKKRKKYTISHSHNTSNGSGVVALVKDFIQHPLKNAQYIDNRMACGQDAGKWLYDKSEFTIINNAVDSKCFCVHSELREKVRTEFGLNGKFVLGHVGRFFEVKNHTFLLDIFYSVHQQNANTVLLLVGDGSLRDELEAKILQLGLQNCVILTGNRPDVNELMMAMDIFVMPSIHEGLPVTLVEAQASGLRCVISDIISQEAKFTDLIDFISLQETPGFWAKKILAYDNGYERRDMTPEVVSAGYDISTIAAWIQSFYLECCIKN